MRISFVGDVALCRRVEVYYRKTGMISDQQIADSLKASDLVIANLEAVISSKGCANPNNHSSIRAHPDMIAPLKELGVNICTLANNHLKDYGPDAFNEMIELLKTQNIQHVGAGYNDLEARIPLFLTVKGITIGILNYTSFKENWASETDYGAARQKKEAIIDDLKKAREKAEILILVLHTGIEFSKVPSAALMNDSRAYIDNGADMVIGHHPHFLQGIEKYKEGLIVYSLGNFIFDPSYMVYENERNCESGILSVEIKEGRIRHYEFNPVRIDENGIPESPQTSEESQRMISAINQSSAWLSQPSLLKRMQSHEEKRNLLLQIKVILSDLREKGLPLLLHVIRTRFIKKQNLSILWRLMTRWRTANP